MVVKEGLLSWRKRLGTGTEGESFFPWQNASLLSPSLQPEADPCRLADYLLSSPPSSGGEACLAQLPSVLIKGQS